MDSEVQRDGRILDLIDDAWREDKLPYEDVAIPLSELPEPEQDNGGTTDSVKEQEMEWTDLALQYLHENVPPPPRRKLTSGSLLMDRNFLIQRYRMLKKKKGKYHCLSKY
ncbi:anaphase-promoting complex subunit 13-like [Myotis daubentonii]|uniref:anaphase-promoting complex subunit 13-like n=1 Tax=Myotis daubentonii TaxID=98922 RepID=UPI0028736437|nr:anaphase-promoting complex subunit 13-like [Myotis daubentonii]